MTWVQSLSLAEVVDIHRDQIARYGGLDGVRDYGLLQSAIATPFATFDGEYLHKDLYEMASAYLYHLCRNHPFIDGNKRTALASALVFLDLNGTIVEDTDGILYEVTTRVARGQIGKREIADTLRRLVTVTDQFEDSKKDQVRRRNAPDTR